MIDETKNNNQDSVVVFNRKTSVVTETNNSHITL